MTARDDEDDEGEEEEEEGEEEERQAETSPEAVCVSLHHSDMLSNTLFGCLMMMSKPCGSRRSSWAFVMKHDIERIVSMVGSRPVI